VLILEPTLTVPGRTRPVIGSAEEAAAAIRSVGSPRVRFAFEVRRPRMKDEPDPVDQIQALKDQVGYYRIADLGQPGSPVNYARILKTIHDTGYADPIGLAIAERVDPMLAIEEIRKADIAAKAL
jgi:sugar phosphate isomerase/epimerase